MSDFSPGSAVAPVAPQKCLVAAKTLQSYHCMLGTEGKTFISTQQYTLNIYDKLRFFRWLYKNRHNHEHCDLNVFAK